MSAYTKSIHYIETPHIVRNAPNLSWIQNVLMTYVPHQISSDFAEPPFPSAYHLTSYMDGPLLFIPSRTCAEWSMKDGSNAKQIPLFHQKAGKNIPIRTPILFIHSRPCVETVNTGCSKCRTNPSTGPAQGPNFRGSQVQNFGVAGDPK